MISVLDLKFGTDVFVKKFGNESPALLCHFCVVLQGGFFSTITCSRTSHYFIIANVNTQSITEAQFPLYWKHGVRLNTEQECFSTQWFSKTLCKLAIFSHLCCCVPRSGAVGGFLWPCHLLRIRLFFLGTVQL